MEFIAELASTESVFSRIAVTLIVSVPIEGAGGVGVIEVKGWGRWAFDFRSLEEESLDLTDAVLVAGAVTSSVSTSPTIDAALSSPVAGAGEVGSTGVL